MNRDDIIRMAREAELLLDIETTFPYAEGTDIGPMLEKFAALVAAAERKKCANFVEACAQVCFEMAQRHNDIRSAALEMASEYIRTRGDQT